MIDAEPWLVKGAVDYLKMYLGTSPTLDVLEFGSGDSTIFFMNRAKRVVSIENDGHYYQQLKPKILPHVQLMLLSLPYYNVCDQFKDKEFDLVLIDGRNRVRCCEAAINKVKTGGVIMLDNSERAYYNRIFKLLSGWKMIECKNDAWTTSWWFNPDE